MLTGGRPRAACGVWRPCDAVGCDVTVAATRGRHELTCDTRHVPRIDGAARSPAADLELSGAGPLCAYVAHEPVLRRAVGFARHLLVDRWTLWAPLAPV